MSESSPAYCPSRPRPQELTIREPELRRLQSAFEAIVGAESRIRHGLAGDRPRLCYIGLDTIRAADVIISDVIRMARCADIRPEFSADFLGQVVDDLLFVEATAVEVDLECSEQVRRLVAEARRNLNGAVRVLEAALETPRGERRSVALVAVGESGVAL